jgi:carbonic anhydrase
VSILNEILTANESFINHLPKSYYAENVNLDKKPKRHMAIVTCMDTRLVDFLEPALGVQAGEAKVIKNAGNTVSGTFDSVIRSLVIGIFELGVKEIFIIGHHDCGVAHSTSEQMIKNMLERGISKEAIHMIEDELVKWLDEFHHPVQNVEHTVAKVRLNPLIPKDVPVHGLIFDPKTGRINVVINGYENLEGDLK